MAWRNKARLAIAQERLAEYVLLADQIYDNPAVRAGLTTTLAYEAGEAGGSGAMRWIEPNPHLIKSLLLDLRTVIEPQSFVRLPAVTDELYGMTERRDLRAALQASRERLGRHMTHRVTSIEGDDRTAFELVQLWLYALYHHRDRAKLREVRSLDPLVRVVHRTELMEWIRNVCDEVVTVRNVACAAGLAPDPTDGPTLLPTPSEIARVQRQEAMTRGITQAVLVATIHRAGGRLHLTHEEIRTAIAEASASLGTTRQPRVSFSVVQDGPSFVSVDLFLTAPGVHNEAPPRATGHGA